MEIQGSAMNLAKRIAVLEVRCEKLNVEKFKLKKEMMEVKGKGEKMMNKYVKVKDKYEKVKEKMDSEEKKWKEEVDNIREKLRQVVVEKRKLEIDLKDAKQRISNASPEESEELMDKVEHLESLLEESNSTITTLLAKNEALERNNSRLEMDLAAKMAMEAEKQKVEEEKILELVRKIEILESEKGEMEAKFCKMKEDNSHEAERNLNVNKAFESAKKTLKEASKKINELVERVDVLERVKEAEKRATEEEGKKKVSELTHRIESLEREKMDMEAKFKRSLNEKTVGEAEEMILEAGSKKTAQKIEVLEREKTELETEVCRAKRERTKEIKKISKEKTALKEMHEKEMLDFVSKYGILEREKRVLEAEAREKDERIKLLVEEKERLAAKEKIMEIKMNWRAVKLEQDVELPQQVYPARNVGILSSLTAQNQDPKSVDVSVTEPVESSDGSIQVRGRLGSEIDKRKVNRLGCSVVNQAGTKRCKLDGPVGCKLVWKNRLDMLNAFTENDELCMRSVCALYRKYKSQGDSKEGLISPGYKGFLPPYETRGMDLGELLTSGDQECRLKKSLAEFQDADPCGLQDCRIIARNHYVELFEIYRENLDPLFISGDDMN